MSPRRAERSIVAYQGGSATSQECGRFTHHGEVRHVAGNDASPETAEVGSVAGANNISRIIMSGGSPINKNLLIIFLLARVSHVGSLSTIPP